MKKLIILLWIGMLIGYSAKNSAILAQNRPDSVDRVTELVSLYRHLHQQPELSGQEEKTSALIADHLRSMGYDVTEGIGRYTQPDSKGFGVIGILKNGEGPILLIRTDMDALPIREETGVEYASRVPGVMHACGHDLHMAVFLGTARILMDRRSEWQGTLMMLGQPSEENGRGALALLRDSLYERFGRPDYILALHNDPLLPAGRIGYVEGYPFASMQNLRVTLRGSGGHGAAPDQARDPILMAGQFIQTIQSIVSRRISPLDPAVVTIGSIHGGTKPNIIPDEVIMELTIRTYRSQVMNRILDLIRQTADGIARISGMPETRLPIIETISDRAPAVYNHPELTRQLVAAWTRTLDTLRVKPVLPVMISEDVAYLGLEGYQIPQCIFWLGAGDPERLEQAVREGRSAPGLHSGFYAPLAEPAIRTGIRAMSEGALMLLTR